MPASDSTRISQFLHLLFIVLLDERWKRVPGWPAYEVSSWGRVQSFWKKAKGRRPGNASIGDKPRMLKPSFEKTGHPHVTLGQDGKQSTFKTSRLVLMAFDRLPQKGEEARHFHDDTPSNCHWWNLKWGTKADNIEDYRRHHGNHHSAKITHEIATEIRARASKGVPQIALAREHGISKSSVSLIVKAKTWQNLNTN